MAVSKTQMAKAKRQQAAASAATVQDWEQRYSQFLERVMANAVVGGDTKLLKEELEKLLAERPKGHVMKDGNHAKS